MPRTARLNYPGGVFHVVSRCVADEFFFDMPGVRQAYLELLGRCALRSDARILAYCVMSNHAHITVVQGRQPLGRLFKPLHTGIAWHVNRQRRGAAAKGPVFAQRPRALLIDDDTYMLEVVRYIHNNPVRAGLVASPSESDWSSHRAYTGRAPLPAWLHAGYVLERFGSQSTTAMDAFDAFVQDAALEPRRPDFSGSTLSAVQSLAKRLVGDAFRVSDGVLGADEFVARVAVDVAAAEDALSGGALQRRLGDPAVRPCSIDDVVEIVCDVLRIPRLALEAGSRHRALVAARRLVTWVWVSRFGGAQIDVARCLRASTSAVARWYGLARQVMAELDALADDVVQRLAKRHPVRTADCKTRVRFEVGVEV